MNPLSQDELARDQTPQRFRDLVELVRLRAEAQPRKTAYIFLDDGEIESGRLTFSELDRIARAIASHLQCMDVRGKSVLLLYPPGIDYVGAFFGCIYAGAIAVPAYPPSKHHVHRLLSIVDDASPSLVMTTPELRDKLESASRETWKQPTLSWLATNTCDTHNAENWVPHAPGPDSLAFLQYTSGSTGNPRGVMVSHGNVLANQELIKRSFQHTSESIVVGWLPLYHDMGLIGNILQPLYLGSTAVLMSPLAFLEKPIRWLRAISKYRAITSGGPSFSYEHCVRRITAEQKQGLDLSRWRLAFNGAEPVRATTMERFYNVFADCGFRREAFAPCYGLAESTLFAAGPSAGTPNVMRRLDRAALKEHRVMEASVAVAPSDVVVSCGQVGTGHEIRVVDPATGTLLSDERVGEIWLAGPSVAQGYWRRPEESEHTFRATLTGESVGRFLRTGDLGFVDHSEVYVTGRIKDLIIIGGRNYYPQDFERVLDEQFEALRPGCHAAFSVVSGDEDRLVVVAEVRREHVKTVRKRGAEALVEQIRSCFGDAGYASPDDIVLVQPGTVPKTSSGKVQRRACKEAYETAELKEIVAYRHLNRENETTSSRSSDGVLECLQTAVWAAPPPQRASIIQDFVKRKVAALLSVRECSIDSVVPISAIGLDSLKALDLKCAVDDVLGTETPVSKFLSEQSIESISSELALAREPTSWGPVPASSSVNHETLSYTQHAIWADLQRERNNICYNLQIAMHVSGALEPQLLQRSLTYFS